MTVTDILDACDNPFRLSVRTPYPMGPWRFIGFFPTQQDALGEAQENHSELDCKVRDLRVPEDDWGDILDGIMEEVRCSTTFSTLCCNDPGTAPVAVR